MNSSTFKSIITPLLKANLRYQPKNLTDTLNLIWFPILKNYSEYDLKIAITHFILTAHKFPVISEILQELEIRKLGISDVRIFLFNYRENKKLLYENYAAEMKGKTGREKRKLIKKRNQEINDLIPPGIKKIISAYGGDIEQIVKYNLQDFKTSLLLQVNKIITYKNKKLLEE